MTTVRIEPDFNGGARVAFQYDPLVVELIKTIHSNGRRWNATTKTWWVSAFEVNDLVALLQSSGHRVVGGWTRPAGPPPPRAPRDDAKNWADTLFTAVGNARIELVHRALTKVLHPDVATGDTKLAQELNAARDRRAVGP